MFSETVDRVVERSKRPDRILDIADYVNATLRSLHAERDFARDSRETQLMPHGAFHGPVAHIIGSAAPLPNTATFGPQAFQHGNPPRNGGGRLGHEAFVWRYPRTLRRLAAVRYDKKCFSQYVRPSPQIATLKHYHYIAGDDYVFVGWCSVIDLYWYSHPPYLKYFTPDKRPAVFDRTTGQFRYLSAGMTYVTALGSELVERAYEEQVYDWMLDRWQDLVIQGALHKLYSQLDDGRAAAAAADFVENRKRMIVAEHGAARDG